jgi:magnesium transporter
MALCRSGETGWREIADLDSLSDLRAEEGNLLWTEADVSELTQEDIDTIAEEFELDALAVEDAMHPRQRPKLEAYPHHLFAVFHQLDEADEQLEAVQIACFLGKRYAITIHAGADRTLDEAKRRWAEREGPTESAELLHTLFDVVVDEYQEIADRLETRMEELEDIVLAKPDAAIQRQLYSLKQQLSRLRRYVIPGSRLLDWAVEDVSEGPFSEGTARLFRDVHDHLLRITDQVRNIDDLAQAVLDLTQTERADNLGEVSRRLTAWAAIFAVETTIAGIYGMNFELVPEDATLFGFWFAISLMAVSGVILFLYFKRRGWI